MLAGIPGERFGRRDSLKVLAILYLVSAVGCASAWSWTSLIVFRFIGGLAIGRSSVLGPMYIAEIAPAKLRGQLVGFFQFNVVFGILFAYFSHYWIGQQNLGVTLPFAFSQGAVIWVYLAEVFPNSVRAKRTKPGQLSLVHERPDLWNFPGDGGVFRRLPVHVFRPDDDRTVLRGLGRLPRNLGLFYRRNAAAVGTARRDCGAVWGAGRNWRQT